MARVFKAARAEVKKHYVEFLFSGDFSEPSTREVGCRDPSAAERYAPQGCIGFRFFDREENSKNSRSYNGEPTNYSGTFYFGRLLTIPDLKRELKDAGGLIAIMKVNGWEKMVRTRCGNLRPYEPGDAVISGK